MILRPADKIEIVTEQNGGYTALSAAPGDVRVSQVLASGALGVALCADRTPVRLLRLRWNFAPGEARGEDVRVYGDEWERGYGAMAWRGLFPDRGMPWVCAVSNGSDLNPDTSARLTECFGVKVRPKGFCMWNYDTHGVTLLIDVRSGGAGVVLGGRTLEVCQVTFAEYRGVSAFSALRDYYKTLCCDPIFPKRPVYGSNNWYYAYGKSSREAILKDTDFLMARCGRRDNPPFMVIDDGWETNGCDGPWHTGNQRFPDMKGLAEAIKARGARPGIWVRYLADGKRMTPGVTEDMRLQRDNTYLDPTHPAVRELIVRDTRRIVEDWGYELIKHDFSTYDLFGKWGFQAVDFLADDGWRFHDPSVTSAEVVLDLYRLIRKAAGDTVIIGCNVIGHLAAGLVELNRTGDDTSGREWARTRKMGVNTLAFRMLHHKAFYDADADCVGVTGAFPWAQNRQWLKALSVSGTPLFVSYDPAIHDEQAFSDLSEAFARAEGQRDELIPLDWMENTCPEKWRLNGEDITFDWYML